MSNILAFVFFVVFCHFIDGTRLWGTNHLFRFAPCRRLCRTNLDRRHDVGLLSGVSRWF